MARAAAFVEGTESRAPAEFTAWILRMTRPAGLRTMTHLDPPTKHIPTI